MRSFFAALLIACFGFVAQAADKENPFKKAKVGDWVEYKMSGENIAGKTKMTVVAKDDKELSYEVAGTFSFMGNEMTAPIQKLSIDLTKSYDPIVAANIQKNGVKFESGGEGEEKLKVGEKEYQTKWTKVKTTSTVNSITIVSEYKMWYSKDVPLSGLVKMETSTAGFTTKLELIGTSNK